MPDFTCRPARPEDMEAAYVVFRRALYDHLFRIKLVTEEERDDPPIASAWVRQGGWVVHLWNTAAENWVAVDDGGRVIGWALSVERDRHLELAIFFVEPGVQAKGIGRALLGHAFPKRDGLHRSILATHDPRALKLYLQTGVGLATTAVDCLVAGGPRTVETDLVFEEAEGIGEALALEAQILGFRREVDLAFLKTERRLWIARRGGQAVGYAFGPPLGGTEEENFPPGPGPMGALREEDIPALLDHVLAGGEPGADLAITLPMANGVAVRHLLGRGARFDTFFVAVLSDDPNLRLNRYVHTSPQFLL